MVSAGGTAEPIDPVRFIGNRSTGKMGVAIAEAALDRGARVTLIAPTSSVPLPDRRRSSRVESTAELRAALLRHAMTATGAPASMPSSWPPPWPTSPYPPASSKLPAVRA